jgi:hypothetical protein
MTEGDDKRQSGTLKWAEVIGGVFIGLLGSWLLFAIAVSALYSSLGDNGATWIYSLVGFGALFAIPVCAGAVLIHRGRGQLGSGMLLGVAIGSIIGAGVCSTFTLGA